MTFTLATRQTWMPWSAFREGQWSWGGAWRTGLMRSGWGSWCSYLHPLPFPGQLDGLASPVLFSLSCPALYFYHRMPLSRCIIQHLLWFSFLQLESTQLCQHTEISARLSQHRGVSHCASMPFTPYFTSSWDQVQFLSLPKKNHFFMWITKHTLNASSLFSS